MRRSKSGLQKWNDNLSQMRSSRKHSQSPNSRIFSSPTYHKPGIQKWNDNLSAFRASLVHTAHSNSKYGSAFMAKSGTNSPIATLIDNSRHRIKHNDTKDQINNAEEWQMKREKNNGMQMTENKIKEKSNGIYMG